MGNYMKTYGRLIRSGLFREMHLMLFSYLMLVLIGFFLKEYLIGELLLNIPIITGTQITPVLLSRMIKNKIPYYGTLAIENSVLISVIFIHSLLILCVMGFTSNVVLIILCYSGSVINFVYLSLILIFMFQMMIMHTFYYLESGIKTIFGPVILFMLVVFSIFIWIFSSTDTSVVTAIINVIILLILLFINVFAFNKFLRKSITCVIK